jgi:type III pantothenate kinase
MPIHVERPDEVGADRLVNAYAAATLHGAPAIVVDLGTATTVTAVSAGGAFLGGAIAPGVRLGVEALATRTAKLPRVELRLPDRAIGRDTAEAIRSGVVLGHLGMLRELIDRIAGELGAEGGTAPRVVLTGGLATEPWLAELAGVDVVDPHLTLRGLVRLHAAATSGARA